MPDGVNDRILAALRAEAESVPVTLTEAAIHARMSTRPMRSGWANAVLPMLGALVLLAVALAIAAPRMHMDTADRGPIQLEPSDPLPPPYDWAGVRDALAPRGLVIEIPTEAEAKGAELSAAEAMDVLTTHWAGEGGVAVVSLHLAKVTSESERMPITGELMYVAESTGHDTGNCITLISASNTDTGGDACFYPNRTKPVAGPTSPPLTIEDAEDCPVTEPTRAPPEIGDRLFGWGSAHGNDDLWVGGLGYEGITAVGESFVEDDGSIGMKYGWWRNVRGQLEITGRRLDGDAPPLEAGAPDGYGETGFQASGVLFPTEGCWEVTGTVGSSSLTFVTFVIRAPDLPVGIFQATQPFGATCLAITVADPQDRNLPARWWNPGASGDCSTRTSDIVSSAADFIGFPVLRIEIPLMNGGTHEISLRLSGVGADEIRFVRASETEVPFIRVEEVVPTFAPVP